MLHRGNGQVVPAPTPHAPGPRLETFALLAQVPGLVHGISTRGGGVSEGAYASLNLGRSTADRRDHVAENRSRVARALGVGTLITPHQMHGATVAHVDDVDSAPGEADALVLRSTGCAVGVLGADCPGLLIVDPTRRALAVAHAGWRGVVAGVVRAAVTALCKMGGGVPGDLLVGLGPGIGLARYEVDLEVGARLAASVPAAARSEVVREGRPGHVCADLRAALRAQLVELGVAAAHIESHPGCTYDDPRFFSHRRDAGLTGRHALVAAWL